MSEQRYDIVRFYQNAPGRAQVVRRDVSLEEAQRHCSSPETSSTTAQSAAAKSRTRRRGPWFDGYRKR